MGAAGVPTLMPAASTQPAAAEKLLTFRSGGWVILLAVLGSLGILAWGLAGTILRETQRPPGDGVTLSSYGVALTPGEIDQSLLAPATLYRDMVPVLDDPVVISVDELDEASGNPRKKPLVPADRVVGVTINGQSRAYPVSVLNVHEIINDTLADVPIAVTYSWLTDSVVIFDRRVGDRVVQFGHSGLVYNSNLVMYDRTDGVEPHLPMPEASLWCQLQARAITGPEAGNGTTLTIIPSQVLNWTTWRELHPETSVVSKEPELVKRYKKSSPMQYFRGGETVFPYAPEIPPVGLGALDRVVIVEANGVSRVYPFSLIMGSTDATGWDVDHAGVPLRLVYRVPAVTDDKNQPATVQVVVRGENSHEVRSLTCLWFAAHTFFNDAELVRPD